MHLSADTIFLLLFGQIVGNTIAWLFHHKADREELRLLRQIVDALSPKG